MERRPKSRLDAELIRECARKHLVSARAVRSWRSKQDHRWLAFISSRASEGLGQLEAVTLRTELEGSSPEEETRAAQRRFLLLQRELDRATEAGRFSEIPILNRSAEATHKFLMACRNAEIEYKRACGVLIEKSQFDALVTRYIQPLKHGLDSLPGELCQQVNPTDAPLAFAVLQEWVYDRMGPKIKEAMQSAAAGPQPTDR